MNRGRLVKNAGAGLALTAAALVGFTNPAQAGNPKLCEEFFACIYASNDFVGLIDIPRDIGGIRNVSVADDDKMDSWENRSGTNAAWYHDSNGGGDCVDMRGGREDNNINVLDSDELSSWRTDRGC